ncbi:MAG: sulfatase [Deltaproteobacteria bacterium]|nr:sulfatase [Deltaproteobacteria bacterium]
MSLVIVVADSVRADMLGRPGGSTRTPFFDGLAAHGTLFERVVSSAPWTVPSIAAMLTGVYAHRLGLAKWEQPWPEGRPSLFDLAAGAGLEVGSFVFDTGHLFRNVPVARVRGSSQDVPALLSWLEARRGREFVAFVHHWWTHVPYVSRPMTSPVWRKVTDALMATLAKSETARVKARELYRMAVERFSEQWLPRLVDTLDLDTTWLVVTADHGESFGTRPETAALKDVFDLHGNTLHKEMLEVPLLVRPPGGGPARRVPGLARTVDLMPTLADLLGLKPVPTDLDGASLARCVRFGEPAAASEAISVMNRDFVDLPDLPDDPLDLWSGISLATPSRKLIWKLRPDERRAYDLTTDPGETTDVSERDAALLTPLWQRLETELGRAIVGKVLPGDAERIRARLRKLGYIE